MKKGRLEKQGKKVLTVRSTQVTEWHAQKQGSPISQAIGCKPGTTQHEEGSPPLHFPAATAGLGFFHMQNLTLPESLLGTSPPRDTGLTVSTYNPKSSQTDPDQRPIFALHPISYQGQPRCTRGCPYPAGPTASPNSWGSHSILSATAKMTLLQRQKSPGGEVIVQSISPG